jgi:hypothetical protein
MAAARQARKYGNGAHDAGNEGAVAARRVLRDM